MSEKDTAQINHRSINFSGTKNPGFTYINMKNCSTPPNTTIISVVTCHLTFMLTLRLELPVQEVARRRPGLPAVVFGRLGSSACTTGSAGRLLLGADPVQDSFGIGPLNHVLRRLLDHRLRLSEERECDQECYSLRREQIFRGEEEE